MMRRSMLALKQRGAGSLIVVVSIFLVLSLIYLYLNRSLIFEQRAAANHVRSVIASEAAEAGVQWALGMLNNPTFINNACTSTGTNTQAFRTLYTPISGALPNAQPACLLGAGSLTCSCPASGLGTLNNAAGQSSFAVSFSRNAQDTSNETITITSYGCTAPVGAGMAHCSSAALSSANFDATAVVVVDVKLRRLLRTGPAAPLTCGSSCNVSGSFDIINQSPATNGILVNAGTSIAIGNGATLRSIPGLPPENALVSNDVSLSRLSGSDSTCNNSAVFNAFFGTTIQSYASAPTTRTINCTNASNCGSQTLAAYSQGFRAFFFPDGVSFNNSSGFPSGSLGTLTDPVTIVTPDEFNINGNVVINGVIFSNNANTNDLGTGTADINGAIITCAGYNNNGSGTLRFVDQVIEGSQRAGALMVKVPGSWRDFL